MVIVYAEDDAMGKRSGRRILFLVMALCFRIASPTHIIIFSPNSVFGVEKVSRILLMRYKWIGTWWSRTTIINKLTSTEAGSEPSTNGNKTIAHMSINQGEPYSARVQSKGWLDWNTNLLDPRTWNENPLTGCSKCLIFILSEWSKKTFWDTTRPTRVRTPSRVLMVVWSSSTGISSSSPRRVVKLWASF